MKRGPKPSQPEKETAAIDRVIRWCLIAFVSSVVILGTIAWYAIKVDRVAAYFNVAGIIYVAFSSMFLTLIGVVFVQGHLGSSREMEAPKMELFEIEKLK